MSTSDLALLHQWRTRHDARAFNELAARHTPMVYATCRRVLRDESSAEDVTQECFEMLATAKRPPKSQLPAWLHRVATNRSLDKLRTAHRRMQREREYVELQKGHDEIEWDIHDFKSIKRAKKMFDKMKKKGYQAFFVLREDGQTKKGNKITKFDPALEEIIMVPPVSGG